jgi:D-alanyl-lipoteichoic acid acyltransferase DltB (MBOAT superfamily)
MISQTVFSLTQLALNPEWSKFEGRLTPRNENWFFHRRIDNSDVQYSTLRKYLPILSLAMFFHVLAMRTFSTSLSHRNAARLFKSLFQHVPVLSVLNLLFSILFLIVLHGIGGFLKILSILSLNYLIHKACTTSPNNGRTTQSRHQYHISVILVWVFSIGILFLNDIYSGYKYSSIFPLLSILDSYTGFMPRWYVTFNFTVLRMISFVMDSNWNLQRNYPASNLEKPLEQDKKLDVLSEKGRIVTHHSTEEYNFFNYLAYCIYVPLYMAGPILSFNSFLSQLKYPPKIEYKDVILYGLRFSGIIFLMEILMRSFYVVAMSKSNAWQQLSPFELMNFSYWNLIFIWMKLLIIWRFFRLWAMADGIVVEENMPRCMNNNYSAIDFWRTWHKSYNRWIIRYLYVPLGGSRYKMFNVFVVFSFVAVWHDIELRLLIWGWLIALFILPEIILTTISRKYLKDSQYYNVICAFGGSINICAMISVNLLGFCSGAQDVIFRLLRFENLQLIIVTLLVLSIHTLYLFKLRKDDAKSNQ